ncbi:MAG: hypothetical protein AAGJ37_16575 [Pseudomonadota bacterium]
MYVIQNNNNSRIENKDAKELIDNLIEKCRGRSVKIAKDRPDGLKKIYFVTVLSERSIVETYNPDKVVTEQYFS